MNDSVPYLIGALALVCAWRLAAALLRRLGASQAGYVGDADLAEAAGAAPSETGVPDSAEPPDYDRDFLAQAADRPYRRLVRTFNQVDIAFIRADLAAAGIASYVENAAVGELFPGIAIGGYTDAAIAVFDDQRAEARELAAAYIDRARAQSGASRGGAVRNVAEFLVAGYAVPADGRRVLPELLD